MKIDSVEKRRPEVVEDIIGLLDDFRSNLSKHLAKVGKSDSNDCELTKALEGMENVVHLNDAAITELGVGPALALMSLLEKVSEVLDEL